MKKAGVFIIALAVFGMAASAMAADFSFHGDMNNRFLLYHNHVDWLAGGDTGGELADGTVDDMFAEIRYRFWFDAVSDDGKVKGVLATEIGGLRFGEDGAMPYSGDQLRFEVRWAYLDVQVPGIDQKARTRIGLQPFTVNPYKWQETIGGVSLYGDVGAAEYTLAWVRGYEFEIESQDEEDFEDSDGFFARLNFNPMEDLKIGLFGLYEVGDTINADTPADFGVVTSRGYEVKVFADNSNLDLWTVGLDGGIDLDVFFVNWDLMYQTGSIDDIVFIDSASGVTNAGDFDVSAYFLHTDAGLKFGNSKVTYTFWYSSGDDDNTDNDLEAFVSTDVDTAGSIVVFKDSYADDDFFTERPYILDKGFIMNRLAIDTKVTDKLTAGAAVMYMMTAEDIEYEAAVDGTAQSNDKIGWELDAYVSYMLYSNVELAINAGYLWAGDAMDFFEVDAIQDGESDEDIFLTSARVRYQF